MKEGLSKFLLKKKIFSLIMVVSIILGMLPTAANAVVGAGLRILSSEGSGNPNPEPLDPGEVWVDKEVLYDTVSNDGTFNVTLKATGRDYEIETPSEDDKVDVVLVLDTSHSMRDNGTRLADMKAAAVVAVNELLDEGLDNRVAIITFNNQVNTVSSFTDNEETLTTMINGLQTDSGTNTQHAFLVAQELIEGRAEDDNYRNPVIILMSDGKPSYYHTDLEEHTIDNRVGDGEDSHTDGDYVWWTVKQAMKAYNDITDLRIYTIGFGVGVDNNLAKATLMPTEDNTEDYRGTDDFNHKYWEDESTISPTEEYSPILQAIMIIAGSLTTSKPVSKNEGEVTYSNIVITDVIGEHFEVVGDLPSGVVLGDDNKTVTWTLEGDDFTTIPHDDSDNGAVNDNDINKVSFKVQIKDTAGEGRHPTNASAKAEFSVPTNNPNYEGIGDKNIIIPLNPSDGKTGYLKLEAIPDTEVTISITKIVSGPVTEGEDNTFTFDVYSSSEGGTPLNESPLSITVTGDGSNSDTISLYLPWDAFNESGEATLYVQENDSSPNDYWNYDNLERKEVTFTKTVTTDTVQFTNTYTPPGTISVTKIWSTGNNTDWPDNVGSVIVELIEAAPDNTSTTPDSITINTTLDAITLTKANPTGFFEDFVKKEDCSYLLNEVTVDGYSTYMYATKGGIDFETGEVTFNNDNSAAITIVNTGNDPDISIKKEVVGASTQTLSGGKATFSYKLLVKNEGTTTLFNVNVADVMSGHSGATHEYSANTSTEFVIGDMQPKESIHITYTVTVDKAGTYNNTATVIGYYIDYQQSYAVRAVAINGEIGEDQLPFVTDSASAEVFARSPSSGGGGGGGGYYASMGYVRVRYVDVDENVLTDGYQLTGMVGTDYETTAKDIEGYTLTEVPSNAEGDFINGMITVVYIYDAEAEPGIVIEEEEVPEALPEEEMDEGEVPQGGEMLPQTGLPIVNITELFGGSLIALGLYFGRKAKKNEE